MKRSCLLIAGVVLAVPVAFASSAYTCTTFQYDSAAYVTVTGINNKGQVVGTWGDPGPVQHAFLRDADGTISPLTSPAGNDQFTPAGINNLGQIAGPSFIINPDGSYIDVPPPTPPPGHIYNSVQVTGINDKGELAGSISGDFFDPGIGNISVFIRGTDGTYKIIDESGTGSDPSLIIGPINNADTVVEHTRYSDGYLLKADGSKTQLTFPGLPFQAAFTGGSTVTQGLNNSGLTAASTPDNIANLTFTRSADGHYPAIVCPDMPYTQVTVGGMNDNNVVAASAGSQGVIATPTGIYPHAKLSNTTWNFAPHPIGEVSGSGTIYISNSGPADLHIPTIFLGDSGQSTDQLGAFHLDQSNCTTLPDGAPQGLPSIPPGGWCVLRFSFAPRVTGWQTAAIYIASDAPDAPEIVRIGGEGIGGASRLQLSSSSWTFAAHAVGETSGNGVIYAYNGGPNAVTFEGIQIVAPAGQLNFSLIGNTCGLSLSPYKTCAVTFNFTPTTPGEHMASLKLNDDSDGGPITIPLYGYGR